MLSEINQILERYDYVIKYAWAAFPFVVTIIMAVIACEQYKINRHIEYCKMYESLDTLKKPIEEKINNIFKIISEKTDNINKQQEIIKIIEEISEEFQKYEHTVEHADTELIKKSYERVKKWIKDTEKYKWNTKEIWETFLILSKFISYVVYAENYYLDTPNKSITLYELIGGIIKKVYKFFVPYWLQKFIKSIWNPFKFRFVLFRLFISLMLAFIKPILSIFCKLPKIIFEAIIKGPDNTKDNSNEEASKELEQNERKHDE